MKSEVAADAGGAAAERVALMAAVTAAAGLIGALESTRPETEWTEHERMLKRAVDHYLVTIGEPMAVAIAARDRARQEGTA